jgi:hypothetical protein
LSATFKSFLKNHGPLLCIIAYAKTWSESKTVVSEEWDALLEWTTWYMPRDLIFRVLQSASDCVMSPSESYQTPHPHTKTEEPRGRVLSLGTQ